MLMARVQAEAVAILSPHKDKRKRMKTKNKQPPVFDPALKRCMLGRGVDSVPDDLAVAVNGMLLRLRAVGAGDPVPHSSDGGVSLYWPNFTLATTLASDGATVIWSVPEADVGGTKNEFDTCVDAFKSLTQ